MSNIPYIPEFTKADDRNKWIVDNAKYFTIIRRQNARYEREERPTYEEAIKAAQSFVTRNPNARFLIYAVYNNVTDALAATVSSDGVQEHV